MLKEMSLSFSTVLAVETDICECKIIFDLIVLSLCVCVCGRAASMNEAEVDNAGDGK